MNFDLYTYGGREIIASVLNGIAIMFGGSDYTTALKIAALIGFVGILMQSAFSGDTKKLNLQWILILVFCYLALLVPKVTVNVKDSQRFVPTPVANIPLGLAVVATVPSVFKNWFTKKFDTVFAMPDGIAYTTGGFGIGMEIIKRTKNAHLLKPKIRSEFQRFWEECAILDIAAGKMSWKGITESNNLIDYISNNSSEASFYEYPSGSNTYLSCKDTWDFELADWLRFSVAEQNKLMALSIMGEQDQKGLKTENEILQQFTVSAQEAAVFMNQQAQAQSDRLLQNVLANSIREANSASGAESGIDAYVLEKAKAERMTTMRNMGNIAKEMLPIMQHVFEVFILAIFPLIALVLVTPLGGKAGLAYIKVIIWVNMWSPLFVIVNYVANYYAAQASGAYAASSDSLLFNQGVADIMENYSIVSGYMAASIPMISWMLVQQSGAMMAGLAGRAIQSYEGTASRASDEASSGNIQAGSVGIGNTNMFKQDYSSSLAMGSSTFESGGILEKSFVNAQGETQSVIQQAQSSTVLSGQSSQTITDAAKSNYQQDITNGNESTRQVLESYGAQLNEDKASLTKLAAGLSTQIDNMSGKDAENSEGFKAMKQARDDINRQIEELDSQATTIETGIGGKGTLPGEALKLIGVRASMAESGVETSRDSTTESFQFAVSQTGEENIKLAERASELLKGTDQSSLADEATDGLRASNSNSVVTNESQMAKIQEGENASYQLAQMEENGNSISVANEDRIIGKLNETGNAKEILNALQTGNLSEQQTKDLNKAIQEVQVEDIARMGTVGATQRASFEENREKIEQKAIDDEATLTNQGFSRVNALKEEGETRVGDRNGEQDIPTREQVVAGYFNAVEKSKEVRSDTVDEGKEGVGNLNRQEDLASVFEDQLAIEQGNAGEEGAYGTTRSAKMDEDRSDINRKRFL